MYLYGKALSLLLKSPILSPPLPKWDIGGFIVAAKRQLCLIIFPFLQNNLILLFLF
jgi:hypothetical protein